VEENLKKDPTPEKEGLLEKAKKFVEKADDFIDENVEKVKKSDAFGAVSDQFDKAGHFVEEKIGEIKKENLKEKLDTVAGQAEIKAKETLSKAKDLGKEIANKTAGKLEDIADNIRSKTKDKE
jgi:ElaB/YqjD/DUF883 family membrane-anchored ribosome-binding protein